MPSKRQAGSLAGIAALTLVSYHALIPGQEGGGGAGARAEEKTSGKEETAKSKEPVSLEGPWLATRAFFNAAPLPKSGAIVYETIKPLLSPGGLNKEKEAGWTEQLGLPRDGFSTWAIVATVADPVHSRMQLAFDGQIQSLEKALAIHDWEFAAQWLPWRDSPERSSGGLEERLRDRELEREQEALPGILVFRRGVAKSEVLFVLLVPETPTAGIAGDAFYAALHLAHLLSRNKTGLLAPSFSGSFESLTRLLDKWSDRGSIYPTVYGGSVSSSSSAESFDAHFKDPSSGVQSFEFRSGIVDSRSYREIFEGSVLCFYNIKKDEAAYWVEEESGFGATFKTKDSATCQEDTDAESKPVPTYWFPRDISHLRSAYQEALQSSRSAARSASPTLDFTLKDPSHGEDSIPVFSDTHTPVGQSAAISTVTEEFRREGTRMVFILAGNTLDSLLLARFVRNESPNTRVVIGSADMLFVPAASQESLNGTLFLSTYPMFILGQEWLTRNKDGEHGEADKHLLFAGADQQGLFNVAQFLLKGIGASRSPDEGDCLYGYRPFELPPKDDDKKAEQYKQNNDHPGLWLLTLTHYGFLPLDWFPVNRVNPVNPQNWFDLRSTAGCEPQKEIAAASLEDRFPLDDPSRGWYLAAIGTSLIIIAACSWTVFRRYAYKYDSRFPVLLGIPLSLTMAQWILVLPAWSVLVRTHDSRLAAWSAWSTLAVIIFGLAAPLLTLYLVFRKPDRGAVRCSVRALNYSVIMIALFLWISFEWWSANVTHAGDTGQHPLLFKMRALQLFSGTSPALPLFVLSLMFCFAFIVYFLRYTEAVGGGPTGYPAPGPTMVKAAAVDQWIQAPIGLDRQPFWQRQATSFLVVILALSVIGTGMFAFESAQFNCAVYIAIAIVIFSLSTACYDLIAVWHRLREVLERLELNHKDAVERVTHTWPRRRLIWFWQPIPGAFFTSQLNSVAQTSDAGALLTCRYLVYAVRQMQRIAWSIGIGLVVFIVVLTTYSVQAPLLVGRFLAVLFLIVGGIVVWIFAGMERNWVISQIDRTEPGDLNFEFVLQSAGVIAVPLAGVLIHLFPSIGGFVSSWLAPSLEALR
jgi:hypothetical protein